VYRERAQSAGQGGMSAGYQSTLLSGVGGVRNERVAGALSHGIAKFSSIGGVQNDRLAEALSQGVAKLSGGVYGASKTLGS